MDLIDASNAPVPITVDPITGNTISANDTGNTMEDTQMADPEDHTNAANDEAEDYFIDNSPTFHDFATLPPDTKATITRLLASAGAAWEFRSMATPFPVQYLPDPDCHNWGLALISALSRLADMTRTGFKLEAIAFVIKHMKERNEVPGNTEDERSIATGLLHKVKAEVMDVAATEVIEVVVEVVVVERGDEEV
ncbi:uncharacterized protein J4E87_000465 [Alternaria ethzedia]|uniref:uncharacterized protein n=1 Tax=Alternaria ethzedia TaxID=181014 RepID=UPI0020C3D79E|nr:uncharacterized protein J4E87_000465 [Alternaria ethzedia]KAI4635513.1 hypothetical protein J4E87_000465 [Alternaria ethzedia]